MTTEIFPIERAKFFSSTCSQKESYYAQYCRILNEKIAQAAMNEEDHCFAFFPKGNIYQREQLEKVRDNFEDAEYDVLLRYLDDEVCLMTVSWRK